MDRQIKKRESLLRKKRSVRRKVSGSAACPRLSVYRSGAHIYGQLIDDEAGVTLLAVSSVSKDLRGSLGDLKGTEVATKVGEALGEKASAAGMTKVVFDRNGRKYAGRVKALADGARSKGLQF